jgi:hypothetical protein
LQEQLGSVRNIVPTLQPPMVRNDMDFVFPMSW